MMEQYIQALQEYAQSHKPDFGDGKSVLTLLYEVYINNNRLQNARIKADFKELYRPKEGMELREMDQLIDPVYILCQDYERAGFVEGAKVEVMLARK